MSIVALKRSRETATQTLANKLKEQKQGFTNQDPNLWKPFLDDEKGIGSAKIRFLPAPPGEELPYCMIYDHGFQGPTGKWYIEDSLTTLNKPDPVSELNNRLWNSGVGDKDDKDRTPDQNLASKHKRRANYYANILVISDPGRPQNEGKVFVYRFGPTIHDMINSQMFPQFADQVSVNPFDMWDGCDLELRARRDGPKGKGFWKYDKTKWSDPRELFPGDDDAKETLWKQCKSIAAYIAPEKFKSYQALQKRLLDVLGPTCGSGVPTLTPSDGREDSAPVEVNARQEAPRQQASQPARQEQAPAAAVERPATQQTVSSDDADLNFFNDLVEQSKRG